MSPHQVRESASVLGPHDLPGRLQATFVPEHGAIAWWGVTDIESALRQHNLSTGRPATCRFAVPIDDAITVTTVPVRLVDLDSAVRDLSHVERHEDFDASALVWRDAVRLLDNDESLANRIPAAAHAVLNADSTAICSASSSLRQFRQSVRTRVDLASAINAELRPYQVNGVAWLRALSAGGVLADEMGLGKTLQAICLLATRSTGVHLVVCPTSVVGNWRREIERFAPSVPVLAYYGPRRALPELPAPGAVAVTSYSILRSDIETLARPSWDVVIFDEAQQIKNPDALAHKAAARLLATIRVAMTGTPVENRLDELWSIFAVTNPGLLGNRARFRQRFGVPIEQRQSAAAAARLTALVTPHLLRRTKSDVAPDLPPKQYSTVTCALTEEQARLYRDAVDHAFESGLGAGIERRGRILALLTALKQICNHPAQFLRDDRELTGRSGKFDRTIEMLTEIADDNDHALVFTQYRAMGELLSRHLGMPFLHGGLSAEKRDRLVHAFQNHDDAPSILILSLRAAGFGLNLTRASHVVHYDRWWNPAVEDQATDRAHRIGQLRSLNVYTLVTERTIEDHIARMHDTKRALADVVSGDTEAALADLSDDDLHAILDLDSVR